MKNRHSFECASGTCANKIYKQGYCLLHWERPQKKTPENNRGHERKKLENDNREFCIMADCFNYAKFRGACLAHQERACA